MVLCAASISGTMCNKQAFFFKNKTEKPCAAKFYYDGAEEFAQYAGFPIEANNESWIKLKEFWWFEKKGVRAYTQKGKNRGC